MKLRARKPRFITTAAVFIFFLVGAAIAATTTSNLGLTLLAYRDSRWDVALNNNLNRIDQFFGTVLSSIADTAKTYSYDGTFNGTTGTSINLPVAVSAITEYTVKVTPSTRGGAIGDIYVSKGTSSFTVRCSEANTTDTFVAEVTYVGSANAYGGSLYREWIVSPADSILDHGNSGSSWSFAHVLAAAGSSTANVRLPGNHIYQLKQNLAAASNLRIEFDMGAVVKTYYSIRTSDYRWTATGSGIAEFRCETSGGGNPGIFQPARVFINGTSAVRGTAGMLTAGQWDYSTSGGFATVIVRLSDGSDPDNKAWDYIQVHYTFTHSGPVNDSISQRYDTGGSGEDVTFSQSTSHARPEWYLENTNPGTTLMTSAVQAAFASGAKKVLGVSGTIYLVNKLGEFPGEMDIENLHLKAASQIAEDEGQFIAKFTGRVNLRKIEVDLGGYGQSGFYLTGDRSTVDGYYAHSLTGTPIAGGEWRSGLIVGEYSGGVPLGNHMVLKNIRGKNLVKGTSGNNACGRVLTVQGYVTGVQVEGLYGESVSDLAVTAANDFAITNFWGLDVQDNAFYILPGSPRDPGVLSADVNCRISSGWVKDVNELAVFSGTRRTTFENVDAINVGIGNTISNAVDVVFSNVRISYDQTFSDDTTKIGSAFLALRPGNVLSENVKILNCSHINKHAYSVFGFRHSVGGESHGDIENLLVKNSLFDTHWHSTSQDKYLIDWTETSTGLVQQFSFINNTFRVTDDTGTLAASDYFISRFPANPGKVSVWENNAVLTDGAHHVRTYIRMLPNIKVRGGYFASSAEYLLEDNYITAGHPGGWGARKRISGTSAPTVGTFEPGDIIENAATSSLGGRAFWMCALGGTSGTLTGVTADTVAGSATITVNSADSLRRGHYVSIAGESGTKKILAISGTTIVVDAVCNATVNDGAVVFVPPVFEAGITYRGTPAAGNVLKYNASGFWEPSAP